MKEVKRYDIYMHSDDVQFLRECPEGDYVRFGDFDSIVKELEGKLKVAVDALQRLSAFDDTSANEWLARHRSYGAFDEPGAVFISREALAQIEVK